MKLYIIVVNKKEQYIVDDTNCRVIEQALLNREDLNFTKRNLKDINKLSVMLIKYSYITHFEIIEGEDVPNDDRQIKEDVH